jgi:hypothetical protein
MASGEEKGSRLRQGHRTSLNTDTSYVSSTNSPTPQLVTIGSGQSVTFRPTLNEAKVNTVCPLYPVTLKCENNARFVQKMADTCQDFKLANIFFIQPI